MSLISAIIVLMTGTCWLCVFKCEVKGLRAAVIKGLWDHCLYRGYREMMNEQGTNAWINETRGIMEIIVFVKYAQGGEKYIHIKVKRKSSNLPDSKFGIDL